MLARIRIEKAAYCNADKWFRVVTPEQQRDLDLAIIAGRLVDAIALYRAATAATLPEAQAYVSERNAEMIGRSAPTLTAPTVVSLAGPLLGRIGVFVGVVVVLAVAVPLIVVGFTISRVAHAFNPAGFAHGFASLATIAREPYYPDVVREIQRDRGFQRALGPPVVIDDSGVACAYIHDDAVQHKANCDIPVHGTKAAGTVRVQIVDQAATLDLGAWLRIGDRTIPIDS